MPSNSPESQQAAAEPIDHLAIESDREAADQPLDSAAAAAAQQALVSDTAAKLLKQRKQSQGTEAAASAPRTVKPVAGPRLSGKTGSQPKQKKDSKAAAVSDVPIVAADHAAATDTPCVPMPSEHRHLVQRQQQKLAPKPDDRPAAPLSETLFGATLEPVRQNASQQKGKHQGATFAKSKLNAGAASADIAAANQAKAPTSNAAATASTARKVHLAVDHRKAPITKQNTPQQQVQSAHSV